MVVGSPVPESDFPKAVIAHEAAFVNVSSDSVDVALSGVLPHRDVASVFQSGLKVGVLGNHDAVVIEFSLQMLVVEVRTRIYQRLLLVGRLDEFKKLEQRVAEGLCAEPANGFNVNHRQQLLLIRQALGYEIL